MREPYARTSRVHTYVDLDYTHKCSRIWHPSEPWYVACFSADAEMEALQKLHGEIAPLRINTETSDDAFCEWAYFWPTIEESK